MTEPRLEELRLHPDGDGGFVIDGGDLAALFGADAPTVRREMADGRISSRLEKGEEEHAGTWRLTFFRGRERVQLTVDAAGRVLRRSRVSWSEPPSDAPGPRAGRT